MPQTFSIKKQKWIDCEFIYKNVHTVVIKIGEKFCKVPNHKYYFQNIDKDLPTKTSWFQRFIKWWDRFWGLWPRRRFGGEPAR